MRRRLALAVRRTLRRYAPLLYFWLGVEASYLAFCVTTMMAMQRRTPRRLTAARRRRAFEHALAEADDFAADMALWLGASDALRSLRRGDLEVWLADSFFSLTRAQLDAADAAEVHEYADAVETALGLSLAPGTTRGLRPMLLSTSTVLSIHRPLALHACTHGVCGAIEQLYLRSRGFTRYAASGARRIAYWHRAARAPGAHPNPNPSATVFVHGIGLGIAAPYLPFVHALQRALAASRDIFLVEIRRCRMAPEWGDSVPSEEIVAASLARMLSAHGHADADWVAHSFGSFVVAWVVYYRRSIINRLALVDPTCFLLSNPAMAHTVMYRARPALVDAIMLYLRTEPRIARTMRRHFCWIQNSIRADELPPATLVILAERDVFTPVALVEAYLARYARPGLEVECVPRAHHGFPLMTDARTQARVIAFCGGAARAAT